MGFHPRNNGVGCYRPAKAQHDCECFICRETIRKGEFRYSANRYLSLCTKCAECWEKEGGALGKISRATGGDITLANGDNITGL